MTMSDSSDRGFPGAVPHEPTQRRSPDPQQHPEAQRVDDTPRTEHGYRRPWTRPEEENPDRVSLSQALFSRSHRHGDAAPKRTLRAAARVVVNDAFPNAYAKAIDTCQQPVTTGRRIGVLSPVGGAGKSTLTAGLALLLEQSRIDHIAAVDLGGRPSGLALRLPSEDESSGVRALAAVAARRSSITLEDLSSHSAQLRSTLHRVTLAENDGVLGSAEISGIYQVLSHTAAVSVIELPELSPELGISPVQSLHCLILAVPPHPAAAESAAPLLSVLRKQAPEIPVLAVLIDTHRSRSADRRLTAKTLKTRLAEAGLSGAHYTLSADRHLATGLKIMFGRVGEQRRLQIAELAADALAIASGSSPAGWRDER